MITHNRITTVAIAVLLGGIPALSRADLISVDANSCDDASGQPAYCSLSTAIKAAGPSDTIWVAAGEYSGKAYIDKSLTLVGPNSGVCGSDESDRGHRNPWRAAEARLVSAGESPIELAPGVTDVLIDGFDFVATGKAGIAIDSPSQQVVSRIWILNNVVEDNSDAPFVQSDGAQLDHWEVGCNFADKWQGADQSLIEILDGSISNSRIVGNTIQGSFTAGSSGLDLGRALQVEISGNWIGRLSGFGLHATGGSGALWIRDNRFYSTNFGLLLETGSDDPTTTNIGSVVFERNQIAQITEHGFELAPSATATYAGAMRGSLLAQDNTYDESADLLVDNGALVKLSYDLQGAAPGALHLYRNIVRITPPTPVEAATHELITRTPAPAGGGHALQIGGLVPADIRLHDNQLSGLEEAASGSIDQPTAVLLVTAAPVPGEPAVASTITAQCNQLRGFGAGIAVRDGATGAVSGLPPGIAVRLSRNNIEAQYELGIEYSSQAGVSTIVATKNWWGCPQGPGGVGCSRVAGRVDTSSQLNAPADCKAAPIFEDGFEVGSLGRWSAVSQ